MAEPGKFGIPQGTSVSNMELDYYRFKTFGAIPNMQKQNQEIEANKLSIKNF